MRGEPTVTYLDAGSIASLPVRIPVVSLGSGRPILSILCGVHGDETASIMTSYRLMKRLSAVDLVKGTVRIVTSANPFAQATHSRVAFSDFYDLNRTGKGKSDGTLTERLAHTLFEFLRDSSLVIDLHEFVMNTPTMAIYIPSEHSEIDRVIFENMAVFEPTFVWALERSKPEEAQYPGSLVGALIRSGVPGFGIETSSAAVLSDEVLDHAAKGLYRVAQNLGIVEGKPDASPAMAYKRTAITADSAGLWEPIKSAFDEVIETDVIGRIVSLNLTGEESIAATNAGTILQLAGRQLVDTGTNLFAIGVVNHQVTEALRSAINR